MSTGPANVGARGEGNQPLLLGVAVEADDGAQPAGDRGPSFAPALELAPEALDVRSAHREEGETVLSAPDDELAQVEGVRVTGQPAVAGQETGQGELFGRAEQGIDALDGGGCHGVGHSRPLLRGPEPGAGAPGAPTISRPQRSYAWVDPPLRRAPSDRDDQDALLTFVDEVDDPVAAGNDVVEHLDAEYVTASLPRRALVYPCEQLRRDDLLVAWIEALEVSLRGTADEDAPCHAERRSGL